MARKPKQTDNAGELAGMIAQRQDLSQRLAQTEQDARDCDPVLQWEDLSRLATTAQALERAIATLDVRIDEAQRLAIAVERQEREQAQAQRRIDALQNVMTVSEQVAEQAQSWRSGILANLEAAIKEMQMTGGYPPGAVVVAWSIAQAVDKAIAQWSTLAPEWVGLPTPPSREAQALAERKAALAKAEARLADFRRMRSKPEPGEPTPTPAELERCAWRVVDARRALWRLTDPGAVGDDDEQTDKATAGIAELSEWRGNYFEQRRQERRKAALQEEANAALLA